MQYTVYKRDNAEQDYRILHNNKLLAIRRILVWIFLEKRLSKAEFIMKCRLISNFMKSYEHERFFYSRM